MMYTQIQIMQDLYVNGVSPCTLLSTAPCTSDAFRCTNGQCIQLSSTCNSKDDCGDYSDEKECILFLSLPQNCTVTGLSCGEPNILTQASPCTCTGQCYNICSIRRTCRHSAKVMLMCKISIAYNRYFGFLFNKVNFCLKHAS